MLFFGYLVLFYKFIKTPKILFAIFLGAILGASFYFYLLLGLFTGFNQFVFFVFSVIVKKYELTKKILLTLGQLCFIPALLVRD